MVNDDTRSFNEVTANLSLRVREIIEPINDEIKAETCEICLRAGKNIVIETFMKSFFVGFGGEVSEFPFEKPIINSFEILETLRVLCGFSVYSFQNQIKSGFITLRGGHRVGICGTAIINSCGEITNISEISALNFRISRDVVGCSEKIFEKLDSNLGGVLIVGVPASGKTTILRDIARKISVTKKNNKLIKTVLIDERREIAACSGGTPQRDVGLSYVLSGFPKGEGILKAIRTLAPNLVICDEIGSYADALSLKDCLNAGVEIIASAHASNTQELARSRRLREILTSGAFKRIVLLSGSSSPGIVEEIYGVEGFYAGENSGNGSTDLRRLDDRQKTS
ncbi:MAG: stage III sporulation protein AA [Oscillospiraceae bacterium]|jgi:stage III sporulation protein AA|nr:stage III sporulation protein AA [Oscillospiraceae bacterium]